MPGRPGSNIAKTLILIILQGIPIIMSAQRLEHHNEIQYFISNHISISNQNWKIYQSPVTGYVYFANSAGLVEYNGITSRIFSIPYTQGVRAVYVNKEGRVFTGSFEDFGYWEKSKNGGLRYYSLASGIDVPRNDEVWNIIELGGKIYFQSFTTIYIYDYKSVKTITGPSIMLFMFRAGSRFIVQALGSGLLWFDGSVFNFIKGSEMFRTVKVLSVIEVGPDKYWICTANNGIYIYADGKFHHQDSEISDILKTETCNAGLAINDTLLVFGTILKGIVFCDDKGVVQRSYNFSNGLNNNTVLSLFKDKSDGLWIGLDEGVNYIRISSPVTLYSNTSGSLGTIYTAIRYDNLLFFGTNHGLFAADIKVSKGDFDFNNLRIIPNTQGQVWHLAMFDDQILCGHNEGTYMLENGAFRLISNVTGGWSIKRFGDLLIEGTYTGILTFDKDARGQWRYRNRIKGYSEPTRFVEVDYLGFVWAIHPRKGIYRLELNDHTDSIVNILYYKSIGDSTGRLSMSKINNQMVFMTSGYIYAFDYENKAFFPLKSLESGLGEYMKAIQIIQYKKNSYWFILGDKMALFNVNRDLEAEKVVEVFQKYIDLPWREQQVIPLDSNTLLIPTRQAFTTVNLSRLINQTESSSLSISHMVFSGKSKSTIIVPGLSDSLSVPNSQNNLTVFLANPSEFDQEGREYLYRISELGDQWHKTTLDNFSFLNLKSGHYHIQAKTENNKEITEAMFTIRRPFLQSIAAIIMYFILLCGLIVATVKIFRLELNRHRRLIEYEVGKNKLETELGHKNYELMLTMRYLIEKNEIMIELDKQISRMKSQSSNYPQKIIREMERIIENGLNAQTEEWKNAMNTLKLSQQGFFKMLLEKHPNLTPNDLRLCSYLRMNFATKEIAKLLNISGRAVEISRYRLRRKMNLSHDVNLTEYLIRESEGENRTV